MRGYAYSPSGAGHRTQYVELFADLTGLNPLIEPLNVKAFIKLLAARSLYLVTFDDKMLIYTLMVFLRSLMGKKTAGLSLRAQSCFEGPKVKAFLKRNWFAFLKWLPNFSMLAPIPFSLRPRFQKVCNDWIYDPQFWDLYNLHGSRLGQPETTAFSNEIVEDANGRPIVMFIGSVSRNKGFDFFQKIARESVLKGQSVIFVAAGKVLQDAEVSAQEFKTSGGLLIDRFISNEELESLYTISDLIWACYAPSYNQTSGVFGRALQLSVPICVREASLIAEITDEVSVPHLKLIYNSPSEASEGIYDYLQGLQPNKKQILRRPNIDLLEDWTKHSTRVILSSLGLSSPSEVMDTEVGGS